MRETLRWALLLSVVAVLSFEFNLDDWQLWAVWCPVVGLSFMAKR